MLNRDGLVRSILVDLAKAYDCLKYNLLLAKLQAHGFIKKSIRSFLYYLTNRTQRTTFSDWTNIVKCISHSSILSLLLFDIFIKDLFSFSAKCEICYFTDDNSLYSCGMNSDNIFINLIQDT